MATWRPGDHRVSVVSRTSRAPLQDALPEFGGQPSKPFVGCGALVLGQRASPILYVVSHVEDALRNRRRHMYTRKY